MKPAGPEGRIHSWHGRWIGVGAGACRIGAGRALRPERHSSGRRGSTLDKGGQRQRMGAKEKRTPCAEGMGHSLVSALAVAVCVW